ncbi:hypothetical protein PGT21_036197 [Puccinia graminis f. sp. tritici]|uniref:Uncharacterized protein n=1 Tax=Puccinia graminis f. sp. tritici TaxID=56615 RepID=A0A5B0Q900_PUCGR|nr:hypothetical protein PGTUg99_005279 [Puccinia graminis f. sp. tritici]KAA1119923.1 hypothetical protein PGT21_036197 [Puccinia graminis f. sp. tritici]
MPYTLAAIGTTNLLAGYPHGQGYIATASTTGRRPQPETEPLANLDDLASSLCLGQLVTEMRLRRNSLQ